MSGLSTRIFMGVLTSVAALSLIACQPSGNTSLQAGGGTPIDRTNDPVVATVDGTPIYRSDVRRAAEAGGQIGADETLDLGGPIFLVSVNELIDQRLLALDAERTGAVEDEETQRRLTEARERIIGNYRVEAYLEGAVNDETIFELYEAQRDMAGRGEERRVRQIVVADEALAAEIARRLAEEEDFETLAAEFSTDDATREAGGELGWVSRDMLGGTLRTAVFNTEMGGRAGPLNVDDEWIIVEVLDTRTPSNRSFEEVRDEIARFMTFQAVDRLLTDLREDGDIDRLYEDMVSDEAPTADKDMNDEATPE